MAAWLWLLVGLWAGMGIGMAVTAFVFAPAYQHQSQIKPPQKMLAQLVDWP